MISLPAEAFRLFFKAASLDFRKTETVSGEASR